MIIAAIWQSSPKILVEIRSDFTHFCVTSFCQGIVINRHSRKMSLQLTHKGAARTDRKHIAYTALEEQIKFSANNWTKKQLPHEKEVYTCWDSKISKTNLNKTAIPFIKFIYKVMR